jgi:four helix bundle protein
MFRFEKLDVWHRALDFADRVYDATDRFPTDERFGLTAQMRRSAISISSNIAEGSGRASDSDFSRFLEYAYSSLMEDVSQAHVATRRRYLVEPQFRGLCADAEELARMLSGLRTALGGGGKPLGG